MVRLKCPNCANIVDVPAGTAPSCPACGFRGMNQPASVPPPMAPLPNQGFSNVPSGMAQQTSGKAVAALILGIVSMCVPYVGLITGPLAIIFGVLGKKDVDRDPQAVKGRGMAIAGLVLGIVSLVLYVLFLLFFGALLFAFDDIERCIDDPEAPGCEDYQSQAPDTFGPLQSRASTVTQAALGPGRLAPA